MKGILKLEELDKILIQHIHAFIVEIDRRYQLQRNPNIALPFQSIKEDYCDEIMNYLDDEGVVDSYEIRDYGHGAEEIQIKINCDKFVRFRSKIKEVYKPLNGGNKKQNLDEQEFFDHKMDVVYKIKYTDSREILLNNILLTRVDFGSENDNVFDYIYRNPNRTIDIQELEHQSGCSSLTKSLHKIVENLGFSRELKRAFFSVSKSQIFFRNPLTRKGLEVLEISWIRVPRR